MTDRQHIRRLKRAIERVQAARRYGQTAQRMVREAEAELRAAVRAAMQGEPPSPDGEKVAAA